MQQRSCGTADRELRLLGRKEVAVHRMVGVDADAAVHVHRGVGDTVPRLCGPERGRVDVDLGGQTLGQFPCRLRDGQAQRLDVDVAVGQPRRDGLEAADRTVELLTFARILGGEFECALEDAELKRAAAQCSPASSTR